jgi:hypothetical protein
MIFLQYSENEPDFLKKMSWHFEHQKIKNNQGLLEQVSS